MDPLLAPLALIGFLLIRIGIPAATIFFICKCLDKYFPEV